MASRSIGRTAEFEEILLPHASLADRCWLRSRWRHRRSSAYGSQHVAEPNTFSGSCAPSFARAGRWGGVTRHALESRPFRPAGQAKRPAHLRRGSQLGGGSAGGQPRGEQSPGRVPNVCRSRPGADQARRFEQWIRVPSGVDPAGPRSSECRAEVGVHRESFQDSAAARVRRGERADGYPLPWNRNLDYPGPETRWQVKNPEKNGGPPSPATDSPAGRISRASDGEGLARFSARYRHFPPGVTVNKQGRESVGDQTIRKGAH
jgi:hypothetical protein